MSNIWIFEIVLEVGQEGCILVEHGEGGDNVDSNDAIISHADVDCIEHIITTERERSKDVKTNGNLTEAHVEECWYEQPVNSFMFKLGICATKHC